MGSEDKTTERVVKWDGTRLIMNGECFLIRLVIACFPLLASEACAHIEGGADAHIEERTATRVLQGHSNNASALQ